jgi:hypothetical protein
MGYDGRAWALPTRGSVRMARLCDATRAGSDRDMRFVVARVTHDAGE